MADRVFVDTTVLVYARDASEPEKQARAAAWLEWLWQQRAGRVSVQVLQEYYVTVTATLKPGLPRERARADVQALTTWRPEVTDTDLVGSAWRLQDRYRLSYWDAAIAAAARRAECAVLLSEDLEDGQDIDGVTVRNPFVHDPPGGAATVRGD